jgi:hypothetical protein
VLSRLRTPSLMWVTAVLLSIVPLVAGACGRAPDNGTRAASGTRSASPSAVAQSPSSSCSVPPAQAFGALLYDSSRKQVVLFGGFGDQIYGDTWLWSGTCWRQVTPSSAPPPRFLPAYAFDPLTGVSVIYGGRQGPANSSLYDTWTWDGRAWNQVVAPGSPQVISPVAAFDPPTGKVLLFGMAPDYKSVQTWMWDGGWHQLQPATSPTARSSTAMAYDVNSGHIILFGGRTGPGDSRYLGDTWSWDGTNWTQLKPVVSPSARQTASMVSASNGAFLYGGLQPGVENTDSWIWEGTTWRQIGTAHAPPASPAEISLSTAGILALVAPNGSKTCQTFELSQGDWVAK